MVATRWLLILVVLAICAVPVASAEASGGPIDTVAPAIKGIPKDGTNLYAVRGKWTGVGTITYAYQWQLCNASGGECADVTGAESTVFKPSPPDVGSTVRLTVTASDAEGSTSAASPATAKVAVLAPKRGLRPTITGATKDGQLLSASTGTWKGTPPLSFTYQWSNCVGKVCAAISGATAATYRANTAEIGQRMQVAVTATNAGGSATRASALSTKVIVGPPVNTVLPAVAGTPLDGQVLTASTGTWAGTPPFKYTYQWDSCSLITGECNMIAGATSSTYTAGPLDVTNGLEVVVTATSAIGSTSATSPETNAVSALLPQNTELPSITGQLLDGGLLKVLTGAWSGTGPLSYTYQWQKCNNTGGACENITGAEAATFGLISSLVGDTIRVLVTATNSAGSTTATSPATTPIGALLPSNTELPSITGQPPRRRPPERH